MRKVAEPLSKRIGRVRLYEEDIRDLLTIFKEGKPPVLQLGNQQLDSIDELDQLNSRIFESMSIKGIHSGHQPRLDIDVDRDGGHVYSPYEDFGDKGGFTAAIELLESKRTRRYSTIICLALATFIILTILITAFMVSLRYDMVGAPFLILVAFGPVAFIMAFSFFRVWDGAPSRIVVGPRPARSTFWQRKRDDLALLLISNFITLISGFLAGFLLGKGK
jgi:hypothetical protein